MQLLHQTKGRGANSDDNRLAEELYRASTSHSVASDRKNMKKIKNKKEEKSSNQAEAQIRDYASCLIGSIS